MKIGFVKTNSEYPDIMLQFVVVFQLDLHYLSTYMYLMIGYQYTKV